MKKQTTIKAWLLATRPRTLAATLVPVFTSIVLAWKVGYFKFIPAFLCILFALLAQVAANFSNDYFDMVKGSDTAERVGPERGIHQGVIKEKDMLHASLLMLGLACCFGAGLIFYGGWQMIIVGICCVIGCLAYTAGPYPLAYHGLGDVFVFIFFGLVSVVFTYYVQAREVLFSTWMLGIIMGLATVNILLVNNYRDMETDKKADKKTTIVLFGRKFGSVLYLFNGILIVICGLSFLKEGWVYVAVLPFIYLIFHVITWNELKSKKGKALNAVLGKTARNLFLLGFLICTGLFVS